MRVIAATGQAELDGYLKKQPKVDVVAEVYYREALTDAIKRKEADVAVVSAYLEGKQTMAETIWRVRAADVRVVFLAGEMKKDNPLACDLVAMGVYDILFSPIKAGEILERLHAPGTFAQAVKLLRSNQPEGKRLSGFLKNLPWPGKGDEDAGNAGEAAKAAGTEPGAGSKRRGMDLGRRAGAGPAPPSAGRPGSSGESGGGDGALHPPRPVIAVWSPAPSGKTFTAINLARALAAKTRVALLDLDLRQRAVHTWLLLPHGENALGEALERSGIEDLPEGVRLPPRLCVYASDPGLAEPVVRMPGLARLLASPQLDASVVVVDLPSSLPAWGRKVTECAASVVLVADPDYAHLVRVREAARTLKGRFLVLLNRACRPRGVEGWNVEEILKAKPAAAIPDMPEEVYGCIAEGALCYERISEFRRPFDALAEMALAARPAGGAVDETTGGA